MPADDTPWSGPGVWRNRSRLVRWARLWRTRRPLTFNEKVRYKLLRDRRQLVVTFADKAAVREHISAAVGSAHLPGLLALLDDPAELTQLDLPRTFVVKPTHGSGACVVVSDRAPAGGRLPGPEDGWSYTHVRPEHADREALAAIGAHWSRTVYGRGPNHEWAYGRVRPRVLVEELLTGPDGDVPVDHKMFVFHGRCRFVQVDSGRFGTLTRDFFDRSWRPLELVGGRPRSALPSPRPDELEAMLVLAERLGSGTDFVRVDLFRLPGRVVVGELTSSPAAGDSPFDPPCWNEVFGAGWEVPRSYR